MNNFLILYFMEFDEEDQFNREVMTFISILEGLGGILEIIVILSAFLVSPINAFFY